MRSILREMMSTAYEARDQLQEGNFEAIGNLLHENWQRKKQLASQISNGTIDALYRTARKAGALGGKITGAGGGGFLLLYCPYERRDAVRTALAHMKELPFKWERDGSKVIFNYQR